MLERYVIRIYRRMETDPQHLVGIIEIVQDGTQRRFSSIEELCQILTADHECRPTSARDRKPED